MIAITADSANDCATLPPRRLLARRAGQTVTGTLTATGRQLYLPAGRTQGARLPGSEVAAGIVLYALGALLLALIIRQVRGPAWTQPVPCSR